MNGILSIDYATISGFPAGSVVSGILVTLTASVAANSPPAQTVAPSTPSVIFLNLAADTYAYSVVAVNAAGDSFGTPVTGTLIITSPATVSLSLPSTVSATQS